MLVRANLIWFNKRVILRQKKASLVVTVITNGLFDPGQRGVSTTARNYYHRLKPTIHETFFVAVADRVARVPLAATIYKYL